MMGKKCRSGTRKLLVILALAALVSVTIGYALCTPSTADSAADNVSAQTGAPMRRVNVPYFDEEVRFSETAIFWFGEVDSTSNYTDVRLGYTDSELYIRLAVFDRRLWYDTIPSAHELAAWDAATLYLDLDGNAGQAPDDNTYRFVGQLNWWEKEREPFQTAYRGDGSGWVGAAIPFTTTSGWRGDAPNNETDDRGWALTFRIPFSSVGLSGPPPRGTIWGLGVEVHDRDDEAGTPIIDKTWPEALHADQPSTWGQLAFGLPTYTPPPDVASETIIVRHRLNGTVVPDAAVGGTTDNLCPSDPDYIWNAWGNDNFAGAPSFNIQNQSDVADWPCFAKYYVTFPLHRIPADRAILSATLKLHQFGNAGGGEWGDPDPSLIQVFTVAEDWEETGLTWNDAPLPIENVSATWVNPVASFPGWPGSASEWNVSRAVAQAYATGEPLRLALYEADSAYHSGKYFVSSDTGDWNAEGRPTLTVAYGKPIGTLDKRVHPAIPSSGETITYTMVALGSGQPLTLTDTLPEGVSDPGPIQVTGGTAEYHVPSRRVEWVGNPPISQPVTVTFPVRVEISGPKVLANTATLTDAMGNVDADTAVAIVDGFPLYLPIAVR